jgi:hypothetical protein
MIVSVADGERRAGGRVGFDAGEGDAMTKTTTMATMMTARAMATPTDDNVDGDLVRRYAMVVSVVMNYAWSKEKPSFSLLRDKVQASIVPRGRREKQDGPAHKGYRK